MLHSKTGEPANQILQCRHHGDHLGLGLALQDGWSQLELAHRQDVCLLTHLHCSLGQEDFELHELINELIPGLRVFKKCQSIRAPGNTFGSLGSGFHYSDLQSSGIVSPVYLITPSFL